MKLKRLAAIAVLALLIAPGHWWRSVPNTDTSDKVQFLALPAATPAEWPEGLVLEQAWHLKGDSSAFSGFSALLLDAEGFTAHSDFGTTAQFPRPRRGVLDLPVTPLPRTVEIAFTPDVEAATRDASGNVWLAYEFHNAIRRIALDGTSHFAKPHALRVLGLNNGIEAMARLSDGRFLMLSEQGARGFLFAADPVEGDEPALFHVELPPDFRPTDMTTLPDGRVLVLLRKLTWGWPPVASMVALGDPAAIREGEDWMLEPLVVIDQPGLRENYEGIAVEPAGADAWTIWLISDNNRAAIQRNLLLKLRWQTQTARAANRAGR